MKSMRRRWTSPTPRRPSAGSRAWRSGWAASTCWSTTRAARGWARLRTSTRRHGRGGFPLHFFSAVRLARLCAPLMEQRGGGSIINISSVYGREAGGPLTYNASKAAMISFTKMLSRELAPKGIRVNTVAPGSILYPGGNWEKAFKANPAFEKDFLSHEFPAGRLGRPEEVAYAVVCLASPRASWITGTCLPVDGAQGKSLI